MKAVETNAPVPFDTECIFPELLPGFLHTWQRFTEIAPASAIEAAARRRELATVWCASDFISSWCIRNPLKFTELVDQEALDQPIEDDFFADALNDEIGAEAEEAKLDSRLRQFRQRQMVRLAWRDLAGFADLEETMQAVSSLAEASLEVALKYHFDQLVKRFGCPRDEQGERVNMVVLGLGKLGGQELNYSSDIDLMYVYDGAGSSDGKRALDNQEFFIKLGRKVIGSLDRIDADGFVFRTDLRLRPNGDSGPLVLSFAAMEHYYQTHGRNWERYALIKARVVAGDRQSGAQLLRMLKPFVYRKYLDFSAFDSIREMKTLIERQLESSGAQGDVKLGRGGIREIEFLVQNHQLIRGGREKNLQTTSLYVAMQQMVELGVIDQHAHDLLLDAYRFLRNVEHRLQMVADRQTQKLPQETTERARLAMAMRFEDWHQFVEQLDLHRENVHRLFGELLESPQRSATAPEISRLGAVWQGQLDKTQARAELASTGFKQADNIPGLLEQFRAGSLYRAFSSIERDRLDRLMPLVLKQAGSHSEAERTMTSFIAMVEAIGRRSVYLSLLIENPIALKQLLHLCAASPWISRHIGQHPVVLDELLQPLAGAEPQSAQQVTAELSHRLDQVESGDVEAQMNALREFHHAQVLRIAAADVGQQVDGDQVQRGLTRLAEVILEQVLHDAVELIEKKQGPPPGDVGVIAYGKFAGQELGYHSDLDIVVCFEPYSSASPAEAEYYFSRVGQRLINLLTTRTAAGTLYELDMRLRPSGRSGTLVTSLKAFEEYQLKNAWTWEHQALVRARMVVGGVDLVDRFETIRRQVLCAPRESQKLKTEIVDMRRRMVEANCKSDTQQYDIKLDYGGIVDVEFLVQYLVLIHAAGYPQIIEPRNTREIIQLLADHGLLDSDQARLLSENYRQFLQRSLELKLMDRQVMISQQELVTEREQVKKLWQATFY